MRASSGTSETIDPCGLDFRARLVVTLLFSTVCVYLSDTRILTALSAVTFAYLLASTRRYRLVAVAYALVVVMTLLSIGVVYLTYLLFGTLAAGTAAERMVVQTKEAMLGNFHTPFLRALPSLNVLLALALNLSVQKFTGALKALGLPRVVVLPLLVFCRFVPEFVDVVRQLRDAVRMRGFSVSFGSAILHPLQSLRLTAMPLTVRTLRIADNLAMAAEMKRVGSSRHPTHLNPSRLRTRDWMTMAAAVAVTAAVVAGQASVPQTKTMMSGRGAQPTAKEAPRAK